MIYPQDIENNNYTVYLAVAPQSGFNNGPLIIKSENHGYTEVLEIAKSVASRFSVNTSDMGHWSAYRDASTSKKREEGLCSKPKYEQGKGVTMHEISRSELEAHLSANKAEVDVVASEMRREMAEFRTFQAQQFALMTSSLGDINNHIANVKGEVIGLKGQIDGLKTTSATLQWMVGAILALLALILALPQVQEYFKGTNSVTESQATHQVTPETPLTPLDKK